MAEPKWAPLARQVVGVLGGWGSAAYTLNEPLRDVSVSGVELYGDRDRVCGCPVFWHGELELNHLGTDEVTKVDPETAYPDLEDPWTAGVLLDLLVQCVAVGNHTAVSDVAVSHAYVSATLRYTYLHAAPVKAEASDYGSTHWGVAVAALLVFAKTGEMPPTP